MKKVYLDQKDFVRVVHGLGGRAEYQTDVEVYRELEASVEQGAVRTYFSWVHFTEALRYQTDQPSLLQTYCDVVDNLTRGHCVLYPKELQRRELELALAARFGFVTSISKTDYAYGRYTEAVPQSVDNDSDMKERFMERLRDRIQVLPRRPRRYLLGLWKDERSLRRVLEALPESSITELAATLPSTEGFYTREKIVEMVLGSEGQRKARLRELMDGVFSFRNLIGRYGQNWEELKQIGRVFDTDQKRLADVVKMCQLLEKVTGQRALQEREVEKDLARRFTDQLTPLIDEHADEHGFSAAEAKDALMTDGLSEMPSISIVTALGRAYASKHKGELGRGRTVGEHDIADLQHLRNLPYVDCIITDRFAAEMVKSVAGRYGTIVVRSLGELREWLSASQRDG